MWKTHSRATIAAVSGALLIGALGTAGPGTSADAKELKVATYLPPTHRIVHLYEELGKELAADSKGDLTLKVYAGGTLGAGPFQQYKRAVEGTADIADICHAFHARVFSKTMMIVLPGVATSATDATNRLWSLPEGMLASDYKQVKNVFTYSVSQSVFTSREKPVHTLADLKGAKVMTPGAAFAPIIAAWGGSPVPMDLNEMFNALSTGVVDMVALPATSLLPPFRLAEISKHTSVGVSGLFNPCGAIMNKESYAALTPSQKAIFDKHTGKTLSLRAAKIFDDWSDEAIKTASMGHKVEVIQLSPDVRKAMFDAAQPVVQKTLAELEKGGMKDAKTVYNAINK
ncbi:MAG: TRAP transporter substrate-binding protein DctP [Rhizobiales bacterium]|jgi:TRAP-type C4-dicarboxylate transport system substrate-binding protein|nr:TRAP transporter substrate-binding protein DctP [Hyphomicrobiales bacterium]